MKILLSIIEKNSFKIGIARIFNITGKKQQRGYFVPDIINKLNFKKNYEY